MEHDTSRLDSTRAHDLAELPLVTNTHWTTRRKAAVRASSLPAKDPVCEAAALADSSDLPALIKMMGFVKETSRAADKKPLASPTLSM
jgi:hypothetical protein